MKTEQCGMDGLKLCSCGNPEGNLRIIYQLLKAQEMRRASPLAFNTSYEVHKEIVRDVLMGDAQATHELVMQLLDGASNFLDHGGSIHGAWLTESGQEFMRQVESCDEKVEFGLDAETRAWVESAQLRLDIEALGPVEAQPKRL